MPDLDLRALSDAALEALVERRVADLADLMGELLRRHRRDWTAQDYHRAQCHPDYEYRTIETVRKSGDGLRPEGEGWEPNDVVACHAYEDGRLVEERWRNWERFDALDVEFWRRPLAPRATKA